MAHIEVRVFARLVVALSDDATPATMQTDAQKAADDLKAAMTAAGCIDVMLTQNVVLDPVTTAPAAP